METLTFTALPLALQAHILCAIAAFLLGPFALFRKRRDRAHKAIGYVWFVAMGGVAISAFWLPSYFSPFHFGPLHILAALALRDLALSFWHVRRGQVEAHQKIMKGLYFGAMMVAGLLTFIPGRLFSRWLFPENHLGSLWILGAGLLGLIGYWARAYMNQRYEDHQRRARRYIS